MNEVVARAAESLNKIGFLFNAKPILIGGMSMEYYGIRKAGADIDLIVSNEDYQALAERFPDNRKDLYGDLGVVIGELEIWRSIALLDYDYFRKDALEEGNLLIVSIDRLLWMRVCAMGVEKYRKDLELMREYYYRQFRNPAYTAEANAHQQSYQKKNGVVSAGRYEDA